MPITVDVARFVPIAIFVASLIWKSLLAFVYFPKLGQLTHPEILFQNRLRFYYNTTTFFIAGIVHFILVVLKISLLSVIFSNYLTRTSDK